MARIKWNLKAFRELRTLPSVQADIQRRAEAIATAAGTGFDANSTPSPRNRARSSVVTATGAAIRKNATDNTLSRSLDAGR